MEPRLLPCPVCSGARCVDGAHDWRYDKWSLTGPVVWRCVRCASVVEMCTRDEFRRATTGGWAHVIHATRLGQRDRGELPVVPCDVCEGSGRVPALACPRCGRTDRAVGHLHTIGATPEQVLAQRQGELIIETCMSDERSPAWYCGRCDLEYGSVADYLMPADGWTELPSDPRSDD